MHCDLGSIAAFPLHKISSSPSTLINSSILTLICEYEDVSLSSIECHTFKKEVLRSFCIHVQKGYCRDVALNEYTYANKHLHLFR